MDEDEAAALLGVKKGGSGPARVKLIKDRHRVMMMKNHPDGGGSPYVASKVNEAKEILLRGDRD